MVATAPPRSPFLRTRTPPRLGPADDLRPAPLRTALGEGGYARPSGPPTTSPRGGTTVQWSPLSGMLGPMCYRLVSTVSCTGGTLSGPPLSHPSYGHGNSGTEMGIGLALRRALAFVSGPTLNHAHSRPTSRSLLLTAGGSGASASLSFRAGLGTGVTLMVPRSRTARGPGVQRLPVSRSLHHRLMHGSDPHGPPLLHRLWAWESVLALVSLRSES